MDASERQKIVREFFESSALSSAEVDERLRRALDQGYWSRLNPSLSIGADHPAVGVEAAPIDKAQTSTQAEKFRREGYFQTPPVLEAGLLSRMAAAIERLRAEPWPPVFCYVYDEFWQIVRTPSLIRLISGLIGAGYRQNSRIWAFYVPPVRGAQGWEPHSDAGGAAPRLTVWVPLTDATVENGCIYVIPRDRLPEDLRQEFMSLDRLTNRQLGRLLQSTQAVPACAGAYLGWDHNLVHWGSASSGQAGARVSTAMEFVGRDVTPEPDELPLIDPTAAPPAFAQRLVAIGRALLSYERYEPANRKYTRLGRALSGM